MDVGMLHNSVSVHHVTELFLKLKLKLYRLSNIPISS